MQCAVYVFLLFCFRLCRCFIFLEYFSFSERLVSSSMATIAHLLYKFVNFHSKVVVKGGKNCDHKLPKWLWMLFESCCAFVQCIAMFSAFLPVHSAHIAQFTAYGAEHCCVAGNDQYRRIHYNDICVSHYNDTTPPLHYSNTGPWLERERSGWNEDGIKKITDTPPLPPFS